MSCTASGQMVCLRCLQWQCHSQAAQAAERRSRHARARWHTWELWSLHHPGCSRWHRTQVAHAPSPAFHGSLPAWVPSDQPRQSQAAKKRHKNHVLYSNNENVAHADDNQCLWVELQWSYLDGDNRFQTSLKERLTWLALALTLPKLNSFLTTNKSSSSFTADNAASITAVYPALFCLSTLHTPTWHTSHLKKKDFLP